MSRRGSVRGAVRCRMSLLVIDDKQRACDPTRRVGRHGHHPRPDAPVGLVAPPSGRRLLVRSKIPRLKAAQRLAHLGEFPLRRHGCPMRVYASGTHPGINASQDCSSRALEHVTQRHVREDDVLIAADWPEIRGRILTAALGQRLHRLPRVPQVQRQRTFDTPFNIVLALTLDRLPFTPPEVPRRRRPVHGPTPRAVGLHQPPQ